MDSQPPQIKDPLSTPELPEVPAGVPFPPKNNSWGGLIAILIIILLLIVGALYFWGAKLSEEDEFLPDENAAKVIPEVEFTE